MIDTKPAGVSAQDMPDLDITSADLSDQRLPIFETIWHEMQKRKTNQRAFVTGITGIDNSGKSEFAKAFEKYLTEKGCKMQPVHLDDFHNLKSIRYSGDNPAENYYFNGFDINTIVEMLLIPIHQNKSFSITLKHLDRDTDQYETEKEYVFDPDTIVLFEGVFLFREEFSPYIDYNIFLDISPEESKRRAEIRDVPIHGIEILERYDEKYLPAQKKYLERFPPEVYADMIIDNTDFNNPKIISK